MANDSTLVGAPILPQLVVKVGGHEVDRIDLRAELRVGRAEDNDLDLADPKVSRHHARVFKQGAVYMVEDLGSANGTWVSGVLLAGPQRLKHGDQIVVGDTELVYQEPRRASGDTLVGPSAVAAPPTVTQVPLAAAVPPPAEPAKEPGTSRGLTIGLIAAGVVVILGAIAAAILLLVPNLLGPAEPTAPPTQTPQIVVATTVAPTETSATAGATEVVPSPSDEMTEMLGQAWSYARQSQFEEAIAIYEGLTRQAPEDARPYVGWAWALIWDDEGGAALTPARDAVELDPESAAAAAVLARAYIETGDKVQALSEAQRAVALDSGDATAHAVLAEAYAINGKAQEAVGEADLALVQNINSAEAHRIRGWLYYIVDSDMGRAAGELQTAAGLQPELWLRRHELGTLLLRAEDYTTAIMAFQDALKIRPKAVTYTSIGEAYYRLGQYAPARASLEQAIAAGAEDLDTYALLGATYARLGECDEAKTYYDQALEIEATDPLALEAQDLCEGGGPAPTPSVTTVSASMPTPMTTPKPTARPLAAPKLSGRIAFPVWNSERGKYDTYVAGVDDGECHRVVEEMHQPAFRPDGQWLAVNGERAEHLNLFVVRPDGSRLKEISQHWEDELPCWSPDGKSLVFSSTMHGDKQSRVYVIDEVPFEGRQQEGRPLNFGPDDVRGEFPAWTEDDEIVFQGCDLTVEPAKCGLFIMPSAPGPHPMRQLTENETDTAPAVHGSKIAFMSQRDGNWEIYVMNDDGSGLKRLTTNAAADGLPIWSPDGKAIAFVSDQGGGWAVWAMSPDGANQRKLFAIGGGGLASDWQQERISWAP